MQPPSTAMGVGTRSSSIGTVSMLSRQKERESSAIRIRIGAAIAPPLAAMNISIAEQHTIEDTTRFIATARFCVSPCHVRPRTLPKDSDAREYDRIFALQHFFCDSRDAAKLRAGTCGSRRREVPDLLGKCPTTRLSG